MTSKHYSRRVTPSEAQVQIVRDGSFFVDMVSEAREQAVHHSEVHVGGLAVIRSSKGRLGLFTGANQNLQPGENPSKICAETVTLWKATRTKEFARGRLLLLMNIGPKQADTQSGLVTETLQPCGLDRGLMRTLQIVHNSSIIASVDPESGVIETQTYKLLWDRHNGVAMPAATITSREQWGRHVNMLEAAVEANQVISAHDALAVINGQAYDYARIA